MPKVELHEHDAACLRQLGFERLETAGDASWHADWLPGCIVESDGALVWDGPEADSGLPIFIQELAGVGDVYSLRGIFRPENDWGPDDAQG